MTYGVTAKQRQAMDFIAAYIWLNGSSPSYREVADHLGYKSMSYVKSIVDALVERGAITRLPYRARSLAVKGALKVCPHCHREIG